MGEPVTGVSRLDGQGVVVAGGPGGPAGAVARAAAERGASVVAERADRSYSTCQAGEEVDELFDLAAERLAALSAVVIDLTQEPLPPARPLAETSAADWEAGLDVLLRRPFLLVQRAVQEFLGGGEGGRIVLVAPEAAAGAGVAAQAAGTALRSLVRSVAKEYGRRGIACNAVAVQGGGALDAVVEAVLFLASAEASFVNGEVAPVGNNEGGSGGGD